MSSSATRARPSAATADWPTAYACQGIKFSLYFAGSLIVTPLQRIFEADVCRNYYLDTDPGVVSSNGDVLEELCKISPVQRGVSNINGLQSGISLVPSLFATLLYLALLRKFNKKQMLLFNVFGFVLMDTYYSTILYFYNTFDPRWIVITSMFNFIGGGFPVFNSIMPALIAESVPQDFLSSFQLYTTAGAFLVKIIASSFSLVMMKTSLWFPVVLGLILEVVMVPVVFICFRSAMPLTKASGSASRMTKEEYAHLAADGEEIELSSTFAEYNSETTSSSQSRARAASSSVIWKFMRQHMTVLVESLLPCAVVTIREMGVSIRYILPFWESRRYHWELREVGWVHLAETLFSVLVITALPRFAKKFLQRQPSTSKSPTLPTMTAARSESDYEESTSSLSDDRHEDGAVSSIKPDASSIYRDLSLARICLVLSCMGTILLSISWYRTSAIVSLAVYAGGVGFQDSYFSYLAGSMPEKNKPDLATVYMILSMATLAGFEIGGSMTSAIYSTALGWGGDGWETSAPMWFGAVWFAIAWWVIRRHL